MTRATVYAGLALVGAAVAGAAIALAAERVMDRPPRGGMLVSRTTNAAVLFLDREDVLGPLELSADQRRHVDSALASGQRRADTLMVGMREQMQRITGSTRQAIRDVLDERQRARFDSALAAAPPVRMRTPIPQGGERRRSTP